MVIIKSSRVASYTAANQAMPIEQAKKINTEKTRQVFNTERGIRHFLMTLKVFNIEKGLHPTSLRFLKYVKVLVLKNDYITFLILLKFFKVVILCRECW